MYCNTIQTLKIMMENIFKVRKIIYVCVCVCVCVCVSNEKFW